MSRTIEAVNLGREAAASTIALTGAAASPLARAAQRVIDTAVPPLPEAQVGQVVPGCRSFVAALLTLYLSAIEIGQIRGHLAPARARELRHELAAIAVAMADTIAACRPVAAHLAAAWGDTSHLVFCGSGPGYAAALFSAAKLVEAAGDDAVAQDLEEWAHIQYFARAAHTPTLLISAGAWDADRALECARAALAIGRRLAVVAPANSSLAGAFPQAVLLPLAGPIRHSFSPLLTALPGLLLAAYRAELLGESYFRAFGGGRSAGGGGGISRIRHSHQIQAPNRDPDLPYP